MQQTLIDSGCFLSQKRTCSKIMERKGSKVREFFEVFIMKIKMVGFWGMNAEIVCWKLVFSVRFIEWDALQSLNSFVILFWNYPPHDWICYMYKLQSVTICLSYNVLCV